MPQSRPRPSLAPSRPGRIAGLSPLAPRYRARREARPLGDPEPPPLGGESSHGAPNPAGVLKVFPDPQQTERHPIGQSSTRATFGKDPSNDH